MKAKCKQCGSCCKVVRIEISSLEFDIDRRRVNKKLKTRFKDMNFCSKYFKLITKKEAFEINPELKEWGDAKKLSFFKCLALKNNKCLKHNEKPEICLGYPYYNIYKKNKKLPKEYKFYNKDCGYNI